MIELNFEGQIENKLEVNSNRKNIICNATQIQLAVASLFEIKILSSNHR
jgi:PIN domain nuclease of toxin-antitoxin system